MLFLYYFIILYTSVRTINLNRKCFSLLHFKFNISVVYTFPIQVTCAIYFEIFQINIHVSFVMYFNIYNSI